MKRTTKHLFFKAPGGQLIALDVSFDTDGDLAAVIARGALIRVEEVMLDEAGRQGCVLEHSRISRSNLTTIKGGD